MLRLTKDQVEEIVELYWRNCANKKQFNYVWRLYGPPFMELSFNQLPTEYQKKRALRKEIQERLREDSDPFIESVKEYFAVKARSNINAKTQQ